MALWDKLGTSGNVEDRRGNSPVSAGVGIWAILGVMVLGLFGINADPQLMQTLLNLAGVGTSQVSQPVGQNDGYASFTKSVVGSTDAFWNDQFSAHQKKAYQKPKLVLFRSATQSGCGVATSEVGPHYCPSDGTIYLDETFFDVLKQQLGGSNGDVAQAYVIAHEVGHNVQNQLGALDTSGDPAASVKVELQADCYAGLWARSVKDQGIFENDQEIQEALSAASAVGDDRIQKETTGRVNPETWTHGSSDERVASFKKGYGATDMTVCAS